MQENGMVMFKASRGHTEKISKKGSIWVNYLVTLREQNESERLEDNWIKKKLTFPAVIRVSSSGRRCKLNPDSLLEIFSSVWIL